ncbi:MAG TPA: redoxin domain-containing protein [Phycisphaerae bacterium]|nr:redoxin domain-containing protein [Phycisphaerae bacterium]
MSRQDICTRREVQLASVSYRAPDFTLPAAPDESWTLSKTNGRPRVLVFYPADFSPVCGDQLALYNEILEEFTRHNALLVGISVDGPWCHKAYADFRNLEFPLLADNHPKGKVSQLYGVYREPDGVSERAIFVIDAEGIIRWKYISPIEVNPGAEGILAALESLAPATA